MSETIEICDNCKFADYGTADYPCRVCKHCHTSKWEPNKTTKEDTMQGIRKPIFESEEEFRLIAPYINVNHIGNTSHGLSEADIESSIHDLKQMGYIRRDPVEEAEDMYNSYHEHMSPYSASQIMEKQREAIQHMKPYYEKYKGEKQ